MEMGGAQLFHKWGIFRRSASLSMEHPIASQRASEVRTLSLASSVGLSNGSTVLETEVVVQDARFETR